MENVRREFCNAGKDLHALPSEIRIQIWSEAANSFDCSQLMNTCSKIKEEVASVVKYPKELHSVSFRITPDCNPERWLTITTRYNTPAAVEYQKMRIFTTWTIRDLDSALVRPLLNECTTTYVFVNIEAPENREEYLASFLILWAKVLDACEILKRMSKRCVLLRLGINFYGDGNSSCLSSSRPKSFWESRPVNKSSHTSSTFLYFYEALVRPFRDIRTFCYGHWFQYPPRNKCTSRYELVPLGNFTQGMRYLGEQKLEQWFELSSRVDLMLGLVGRHFRTSPRYDGHTVIYGPEVELGSVTDRLLDFMKEADRVKGVKSKHEEEKEIIRVFEEASREIEGLKEQYASLDSSQQQGEFHIQDFDGTLPCLRFRWLIDDHLYVMTQVFKPCCCYCEECSVDKAGVCDHVAGPVGPVAEMLREHVLRTRSSSAKNAFSMNRDETKAQNMLLLVDALQNWASSGQKPNTDLEECGEEPVGLEDTFFQAF